MLRSCAVRIAFTIFALLVSGTAHWLAARWVLRAFPAARRRRTAVVGVFVALATIPAVARIVTVASDGVLARAVLAIGTLELFAILLGLLPLGLVMLGARAAARLRRDAAPAEEEPEAVVVPAAKALADERGALVLGRREAIERIGGVAAFGATTFALGWGAVRGRLAFAVEEVVVRVPGWPRALDGYVIAQVSDVHVGAFVGDRELDRGFELVRSVRPDLVVATGDLVDIVAEAADPLAVRLAAVGARDGAFAIVGNHDHYAGPGEVVRRLRAAGVGVLNNAGVHLRGGDGGGFALLGVDDLQGRRRASPGHAGPDLGKAISSVRPDLPRVLLAHQPNFFREAAGRVALQLSGHTHGGQINPGVTPARLVMEFVEGRYERAGSTLWVNRGFGTAGPPSRIGAPPEITKIVIVSA